MYGVEDFFGYLFSRGSFFECVYKLIEGVYKVEEDIMGVSKYCVVLY